MYLILFLEIGLLLIFKDGLSLSSSLVVFLLLRLGDQVAQHKGLKTKFV